MTPVADPACLGVMMQSPPLGPDGVSLVIWAYVHPKHNVATMMSSGYWDWCESMIRVGDLVLCSSRYGTGEQHTAFLVRHKGAPGTVVMAEMDARFAFGGGRAA